MTHNQWMYEYGTTPQRVACIAQILYGRENGERLLIERSFLARTPGENFFWLTASEACRTSTYAQEQKYISPVAFAALESLGSQLGYKKED